MSTSAHPSNTCLARPLTAKPLIGVLLDSKQQGSFSRRPHYALRTDYFAAIEQADGLPVGLGYDETTLTGLLPRLSGVLIPGGDYRFPSSWYADGHRSTFPENPARCTFEQTLIQACLNTGKPLLAVCCGMQVMAALLGGQLTHQLPTTPIDHRPEAPGPLPLAHQLTVTPGSLLHGVVGPAMRCNTHHREGVVSLGPSCTVNATAEDGVIEAFAVTGHPFALGLQWHPELSLDDPQNLVLFQAFVRMAQTG